MYGTVRTVVWEDGGSNPASYPICIWCSVSFLISSNVKSKVLIENDVYKRMKIEKVNINTAQRHLLMSLPYIGRKTANDIIKYRNEHGKFSSKEELLNIKGIGEKKFKKIQERIVI